MKSRTLGLVVTLAAAIAGCDKADTGPVEMSAIGAPPELVNPNLVPLDAPSEALLLASAQGLVQFDAAGQIEPALAQSWIVSDDGLRYTFRLRRTDWTGDGRVTAQQVVERLRAVGSAASRNPLKPLLGNVGEIVAMTDEVLEITLLSPRPNFLQLLAQPEMAIIRDGAGTGPFHVVKEADGRLSLHAPTDEEGDGDEKEDAREEDVHPAAIQLRGERAALAIARFDSGQIDLVLGGTVGDLPIARAAEPGNALRFDPVAGLLGLSFGSPQGLLGDPKVRAALGMAVDRAALVEALAVPDLQPRQTLVPLGIRELPQPAAPPWTAEALPLRRARAAAAIAAAAAGERVGLRVALPEGPGFRLIFAHLRRDWRLIGVDAERVAMNDPSADLRLIDRVAPAELASWYLRQFACTASAVCDPSADAMMEAARRAPTPQNRQALLANADRLLAEATPFIPLAAPVRWSLVSPRLTGFRPNMFGRHNLAELVAEPR